MKKMIPCSLVFLVASCSPKNENKQTPRESEMLLAKVETSKKSWGINKTGHSQYAYSTGLVYEFNKKAWSTTVTIKDDQPFCRQYEHREIISGEWKTTESWTEKKDSLGMSPVGFGAKTLDQLYDDCLALIQSSTKQVSVEFFEDNSLKGCHVECEDTCFDGILLNKFTFNPSLSCD